MKKSAQRDANTARWLYIWLSKKIRPAADTLPGGAGQPKFNQLEMVTTFTYRPSLVKIDTVTVTVTTTFLMRRLQVDQRRIT